MFRTNNKKKDVTQTIKDGGGLSNISYAGNISPLRVQPPSATVTAVTAPGGEINTYAANGVDTGGGNGTDTLANAIQEAIVSYEDYVKGIVQNAQSGFQNAPVENTVEETVPVQSTQTEIKVEENGGNADGGEPGGSESDAPTYTRSDGSPAFVWDEATGNWTPNPEPIKDEIEEYYEGAEERAEGVRQESYEANAAVRESAEKKAEIAKERAIVDARSDAELREASYGSNAEALESMGLSASGYGDYIGTQSYAQMRGETQYASAQAENAKRAAAEQEAAANHAADVKYSDYVDAADEALATYQEQKKADHLTTVDTFLKQAELITSEEELEALITRAYGADLTQDEIENIRNIANFSIANQWAEMKSGVRTGKYSAEDIADWAKANGYVNEDGTLNAEATAAVDEAAMWSRYNMFMTDISTNGSNANIDNIIRAESHGLISPEMYDKLMEAYNIVAPKKLRDETTENDEKKKTAVLADFRMALRGSGMTPNEARDYALTLGLTEDEFESEYSKVTSESVNKDMFSGLSDSEAEELYNAIIDDPYVDSSTKNNIKTFYDSRYHLGNVTIPDVNEIVDYGSNKSKEGKNFDIVLSVNGKNRAYFVEHGKRASEHTSKSLTATYKKQTGKDASYGAVMVHDGRIFMYCDDANGIGGWTLVQSRWRNGAKKSFENLCEALGIDYYSSRGEEI